MTACGDTAMLAKLSIAHNLHVTGPKSIRNHMAAFSLFLVRSFTTIPTPPMDILLHYFSLAESLNAGVRAAVFYPDSMTLADTLRVALYRASRVELKDATKVAERGLDALPPDESAVQTFEALSAIPMDLEVQQVLEEADMREHDAHPAHAPTDPSSCEGQRSEKAQRSHPASQHQSPASEDCALAAREAEATGFGFSSDSSDPVSSNPVSEQASISPESVNWPDLMDTLKDCGFEMPMGLLSV